MEKHAGLSYSIIISEPECDYLIIFHWYLKFGAPKIFYSNNNLVPY